MATATWSSRDLMWVQPRLLTRTHELRSGDAVIARLEVQGFGWQRARLEAPAGTWRIEPRGFWRTGVLVLDAAEHVVATYRGSWRRQGSVEIEGGSVHWQWRPTHWGRRHEYAFFDENQPVFRLRARRAFLRRHFMVTVSRDNVPERERLLLAGLGAFLMLTARRNSSF